MECLKILRIVRSSQAAEPTQNPGQESHKTDFRLPAVAILSHQLDHYRGMQMLITAFT